MTKVKFHQTVETGGQKYLAGEIYDIEMGPGSIYFWMVRGCEILDDVEVIQPQDTSINPKKKGKKNEMVKENI